jgi:hypothetical protein
MNFRHDPEVKPHRDVIQYEFSAIQDGLSFAHPESKVEQISRFLVMYLEEDCS